MCLEVLHYNSLYKLILHPTFAHHQVPFSSGVSQNKRTSTLWINKLKLSLHITQTGNLFITNNNFIYMMQNIYIKFCLSEPCVDRPSICVKPFISSSVPQYNGELESELVENQHVSVCQSLCILLITYIDI